ncbi:MAG: CPXCG motif-containing cysteine-rich protein [Planctomycetes bacterium]|nr:CPXCG motif-containing cysteine-rich protein [Planctomycetota bacterium]
MLDDASYTCDACGEQVVVPIDATAGRDQEYVEDCPVCCRPHVLNVRIGDDGAAFVNARPE